MILIVGGLLVVTQGLSLRKSYDDYVSSQKASEAIAAYKAFIELANTLAMERGLVNAALQSGGAVNKESIVKITSLREQSENLKNTAVEKFSLAGIPLDPDQITALEKQSKLINNLRAQADEELKKSKVDRNARVMKQWMPSISDYIIFTQSLRLNLGSQAIELSPLFSNFFIMGHSIWLMTEYAGRERGTIAGILAAGSPISVEQNFQLSLFRGKVEEGWSIVNNLHHDVTVQDKFLPVIQKSKDVFFGNFDNLRRSIYEEAELSIGYSITPDEWIKKSTDAINTLIDIQKTTSAWVADETQKNLEKTMSELITALIIFSVGIVSALLVLLINRMFTKQTERLANNFRETIGNLVNEFSTLVATVQQNADVSSKGTKETNAQSSAASAGAEQTSSNVQSVAAASEEFAASINEISAQVRMNQTMVTEAAGLIKMANDQSVVLQESTVAVDESLNKISYISEQINLLSLNATIEAARAGEAGKGFSVVANEVKKLATLTNQSVADINDVISRMKGASGDIVNSLEDIKKNVEGITSSATIMAASIEEQSNATNEIAKNMSYAAKGTEEIHHALKVISGLAEKSDESATEVMSIAAVMSQKSSELGERVERFVKTLKTGSD